MAPTATHFSSPATCGKNLETWFLPHLPHTPQGGRKKPSNMVTAAHKRPMRGNLETWFLPHSKGGAEKTYLLRKRGKGAVVALFPSSHRNPKPPHTHDDNRRKLATMDRISLTLPYPPSVNHYWKTRVVRRGPKYVPSVYVSDEGQRYQLAVRRILDGVPRFDGRLRVQVLVQPPDHRARDLDNLLKCLLDSLTKAGVWCDDSQVASLLVVRGEQTDGGSVLVLVEDW